MGTRDSKHCSSEDLGEESAQWESWSPSQSEAEAKVSFKQQKGPGSGGGLEDNGSEAVGTMREGCCMGPRPPVVVTGGVWRSLPSKTWQERQGGEG